MFSHPFWFWKASEEMECNENRLKILGDSISDVYPKPVFFLGIIWEKSVWNVETTHEPWTFAAVNLFTCTSKTNDTNGIYSYQHTVINGRAQLFPPNLARQCSPYSGTEQDKSSLNFSDNCSLGCVTHLRENSRAMK